MNARALLPGVAVWLCAAAAQADDDATRVFEQVHAGVVAVEALDEAGQLDAQGSGVVLAAGEVVTNCHVVDDAPALVVVHGTRRLDARLARRDAERDLCLLEVAQLDAVPPARRLRADLKVGEAVYAVGNPLGLGLAVSSGRVSSLPDASAEWLTSAPISPGSSGGGLFDADGRLIGVSSAVFVHGQNHNLALPVEWLAELPARGVTPPPPPAPPRPETDWRGVAAQLADQPQALLTHARAWAAALPEAALARLVEAQALTRLGDDAAALSAFHRALELDPNLLPARALLADTLVRLQRYREARAEIARLMAASHERDPGAWGLLGNVELLEKQPAAALAAYQRALRLQPGNAGIWENLGVAHHELGQQPQARRALAVALRLEPGREQSTRLLARLQLDGGDAKQAAILAAVQTGRTPTNAADWEQLAQVEYQRERYSEALAALDQALALEPRRASALTQRGRIELRSGQYERALATLDRARTLPRAPPDALFLYAQALTQLQRFDAAETAWKSALQVNPGNPEGWHSLADLRAARGNISGAVEAQRKVVELAPDTPLVWSKLADFQTRAGQLEAAEASARTGLEHASESAYALQVLAIVVGRRGDTKQALDLLDRALQTASADPTVWNSKGYALLKLGRHEEAAGAFDTAIRLKPDLPSAWINLGETRLAQGQTGEAIRTLEHAVELASGAVDARLYLAEAYRRAGLVQKAIPHLEAVTRLLPRHPEPWRLLALLQQQVGNSAKAREAREEFEKRRTAPH